MPKTLPIIYRDCRRLLVHTEQLVRHFNRYHKTRRALSCASRQCCDAHGAFRCV